MKASVIDPARFFDVPRASKVDCVADLASLFQDRTEETPSMLHFQVSKPAPTHSNDITQTLSQKYWFCPVWNVRSYAIYKFKSRQRLECQCCTS